VEALFEKQKVIKISSCWQKKE